MTPKPGQSLPTSPVHDTPTRRCTGGQPPQLRVFRASPKLTGWFKRLRKDCEGMAEELDAILWEIDRPVRPVRDRANECPRGPRKAQPARCLETLDATALPDGRVIVVANDHRFALQPHMGALLLALAADTGITHDEGVGFKTLDDLAAHVARRTGGAALSRETLNKYVFRLRLAIAEHSHLTFDPVQTHLRLGRRIAVLRSGLRGMLGGGLL